MAMGASDMFSCPPAIMTSACPAMMDWAPSAMALSPDPHILFMVKAGVSFGTPALIIACRAVFCPCAAWRTLPMMISSITIGAWESSHWYAFFSSSIMPWSFSLSGAIAFMSSLCTGRIFARFSVSLITRAPRSTTGNDFKAPPNLAMAVLAPLTITTSFICNSSN